MAPEDRFESGLCASLHESGIIVPMEEENYGNPYTLVV